MRVFRGERQLEVDQREGTFLGELSTLIGTPRGASVQAEGTVWTCVFNAAELERLLAAHPAVAIRLVKLISYRALVRNSGNRSRRSQPICARVWVSSAFRTCMA